VAATRRYSVRWVVVASVVLPLLLVSFLCVQYTSVVMEREGQLRVNEFERTLMARKQAELESISELAHRATKCYYEESLTKNIGIALKSRALEFKDTLQRYYDLHASSYPKDTISSLLIDLVNSYRFDNGIGYFWINDFHPTMVCHPIRHELDGKDLSSYEDTAGTRLFMEMVKVCKEKGSGFVRYRWLNPNSGKEEDKLSYVFTFEPFGWIIGSGEYLSVLKATLQTKAKESLASLRYGETGFFWINDFRQTMLMHPLQKEMVGRDLSDYSVSNRFVFKEAVELCKTVDGGFLTYRAPKPGAKKPVDKLCHVRPFSEWQWVIGTGVYLDDVQAAISRERQHVKEEVSTLIRHLILLLVPFVILISIVAAYLATRWISLPIRNIMRPLEDFDNDLTLRIDERLPFEFGELAQSFNGLISRLNTLVREMASTSNYVDRAVGEISRASEVQAAQLNQETASIAEITATVEELSATAAQIAENANHVLSAAQEAHESSKHSADAVAGIAQQTETMREHTCTVQRDVKELGASSASISEVTDVISDIAEQTKIIAFNAALEASSAGEAGRRFGVVAQEIRTLADNITAATRNVIDSTTHISSVVKRLITASGESASQIEDTRENCTSTVDLLTKMVAGTETTTRASRQITLSTQQQRTASTQIVQAMREINDGAGQSAKALEELKTASASLEERSTRLTDLVGRFTVTT